MTPAYLRGNIPRQRSLLFAPMANMVNMVNVCICILNHDISLRQCVT